MTAAGHAFTTLGATLASRAGAPEERVADFNSGFTEEHADRRGNECVGDAHFFGDGADRLVGCSHRRIRDDAEHAFRLVEERCELGAPVGDVTPTLVRVETREGLVEGVAVDQ